MTHGIEGITIFPWPGSRKARIRIIDIPAPAVHAVTAAAIESEWSRLRTMNPRFFDGPILSVVRAVPDEDIQCRRSGYKNLAVQPAVDTGTELLSVTAVILSRDAAGREHVLLGRRAAATRVYGDMWEIGPSGGIDPPEGDALNARAIQLAANREIDGEIGNSLRLGPGAVRFLLHDARARSWDIIVMFRAPDGATDVAPAAANWEYSEVRWAALADAAKLERKSPVIPPTRALFRVLHPPPAGDER